MTSKPILPFIPENPSLSSLTTYLFQSLGATQDFADFSHRFTEQRHIPEGDERDSDFVSDSVPLVSDQVTHDSCVNVVTEVPHSSTAVQNADQPAIGDVSKQTLSVEQSDKLIQDIDDILQDKISESSDISGFYPDHSSNPDPDDLSDISPDIPEYTVAISENTTDYRLTNVVLDDSPLPDQFVEVTSQSAKNSEKFEEGGTFDPFLEFSKKTSDNSSEESFVKIG